MAAASKGPLVAGCRITGPARRGHGAEACGGGNRLLDRCNDGSKLRPDLRGEPCDGPRDLEKPVAGERSEARGDDCDLALRIAEGLHKFGGDLTGTRHISRHIGGGQDGIVDRLGALDHTGAGARPCLQHKVGHRLEGRGRRVPDSLPDGRKERSEVGRGLGNGAPGLACRRIEAVPRHRDGGGDAGPDI